MSEKQNGNHPEEKLYEISERARNNKYFVPEAAANARKIAEEIRRTQEPFDRAKFEEFIKNDPILSNMKNISFDDD